MLKISKNNILEVLINCIISICITTLIILSFKYLLLVGSIVWVYQLRNSDKFIHPIDSYREMFGFIYGLFLINVPHHTSED